MGGVDVRNPVAHRLVDGVLECSRTVRDRYDRRAQEFHSRNVEGLTLRVNFTHVHDTLHAEQRRRGGGCNTVLARPGFRNEAILAETPCNERLTQHIVDLV